MLNASITRRLIAGLVFGFIVVLSLILLSDVKEVGEFLYNFKWSFFPLVLLLTLFNYTLRGLKFHYYLHLVSPTSIQLKESFRIFFAGFPLAVTPGKVGEVLKGVWIHNKTKTTTAKGISVVIAERVSDGLAVLVLSTLGVIAYPQYWPAFLSILLILLFLILVSQVQPLALFVLDLASRIPLIRRFGNGLREFYEGSYTLFKPSAILVAVGLGTISWLGEGIGFYVILLGLDLPPSAETLFIAIFVLAFSTIVGGVSALPGGLGASEASIAAMLILLLNMNVDSAAAATLLIRFATLWFGVVLGLITWIFSRDLLQYHPKNVDKQEIENAAT